MKIKIFAVGGDWHFGEGFGRGIDVRPSPYSVGYRSQEEAMTAATHLYAQRGVPIEAFSGHADKAAAQRLGIRYHQGHKHESAMRKFNDDLHLLFKLAAAGRIDWPAFRERAHELARRLDAKVDGGRG